MRLIPAFLLAATTLSGVDLDPITVTGTRTPQRQAESPVMTEVLTQEEILQSGSTLTDVLAAYGVIADGSSNHGDAASLQGLGGARILVLIDGRRVVGSVAQNVDGGSLPLTNVDRIEIVRGPQSALYGSDAMGGVINILTKTPGRQPRLTAQAENNAIPAKGAWVQSQSASAVADVPWNGGAVTLTAAGSRSSFSYNDLGEASVLPRSWMGKGGADFRWDLSNGEATSGFSGTALQEESLLDFTGSLSRRDLRRAEAYGGAKLVLPSGTWEFKLYDHWYQRQTAHYSGGPAQWRNDDPEIENLAGAEAWYSRDLSDENTLTAGVQAEAGQLRADHSLDDGWHGQDREALIVQDEHIAETWSAVTGLRLERGSRFGLFAAPKLSAMYRPWKELRVLGGLGVGYRAPSTEDLYYNIDWTGHPVVLGNPSLTPEYSVAANLGAEWTSAVLQGRLNAYHQELFDEIVFVETGSAPDGRAVYRNENRDRTYRSGIDAEVSGHWGWFAADTAYGWLRAWDRTAGQALETLPTQQLRTSAGLQVDPWRFSAKVQTRWDAWHDHLIVGALVTQNWDGVELVVRWDNLTNVVDAAYGPFVPATASIAVRTTLGMSNQ